jgi:hypothetical protein
MVSVSGGCVDQSIEICLLPRRTVSNDTCAPLGMSGTRAANTSGLPRRVSAQHGHTNALFANSAM